MIRKNMHYFDTYFAELKQERISSSKEMLPPENLMYAYKQ